MSIDREAWLQVCAYYIWQSEGRPDGRDTAHWAAAERVFADVGAAPKAAPAPAAAAAVSTAKGRTRTVKAAPTEAAAKAAKPAAQRKKPAAQAAAPSL